MFTKKLLLFTLLLTPAICFSQINFTNLRKSSWQTFAFKITTAQAEQYLKWDSIPIANVENENPTKILNEENSIEGNLEIGNYVLLHVENYEIVASLINVTNLNLVTINNKKQVQIQAVSKNGNVIQDATIYIKNKEAKKNIHTETYFLTYKNIEDAIIKVVTKNDTLLQIIELKKDPIESITKQKKNNYKSTKLYKVLSFIPYNVKILFKKKYGYKSVGATGYVILNQPKYKPLDTVKFKAYIVNKKWNQYKQNVYLHLKYYNKNTYVDQIVETIQPITAGAYTGEFVMVDSLPVDISYNLQFETKNRKKLIAKSFKSEDYVLDEIGAYKFKADKETYYRNDSLHFTAAATDANGLNLLDGKATLTLVVKTIQLTYRDTVFVKDTLYEKEIKLATDGNTKFDITAANFPNADLEIEAQLTFKNANNEIHVEKQTIRYAYNIKEIVATQLNDSLQITYIENGIESKNIALLYANSKLIDTIVLPKKIRINNLTKQYNFLLKDSSINEKFIVPNNYNVDVERVSNKDTFGFKLYNPYKIPVYYSILNGQQIIAVGSDSSNIMQWQKTVSNPRQMYVVRWQYYWAGNEVQKQENIGLLFKILNIKVNAKTEVYPGQKDSIQLTVTDYKGKPAAKINLTAVSYNKQFKKDIKIGMPPYLAKYKSKKFIDRAEYENANISSLPTKYLLGKNRIWLNKFGLDTMEFYKIIFPTKNFYDALTPIENFVPQLAVHLLDNGKPIEIYMLYINRQLVYYNGVTDKMKYTFSVYPGITQIGIRTIDKYIEIDSFYVQPNYKHDVSIDIDKLPEHSSIKKVKNYWSVHELNLIENTTIKIKNNAINNNAYLWQAEKLVQLNGNTTHTAGPFTTSTVTFFSPYKFDTEFNFEAGYEYSFSKNLVRLEKKSMFAKYDTSNKLPIYNATILNYGDILPIIPTISYPIPAKQLYLNTTYNYNYEKYYSQPGTGTIQITTKADTNFRYIILFNNDNNKIACVLTYNTVLHNVVPGNYNVLLVSYNFNTLCVNNFIVQANGTTVVKTNGLPFTKNHPVVSQLLYEIETAKPVDHNVKQLQKSITNEYLALQKGNILFDAENGITVSGSVVDYKTGIAVPFATIYIVGYSIGFSADKNGQFFCKNLKAGEYVFEVTALGYNGTKIIVNGKYQKNNFVKATLLIASANELNTVIVTTGLGLQRQSKQLGYSTARVSSYDLFQNKTVNLENGLTGKVSGLLIQTTNNGVLNDTKITLRGIRSLTGNNQPLLVVDGIVNKLGNLNSINPNDIESITILKPEQAVVLFGPDGANGAVMVSTKLKKDRTIFKDYAIWEPNFFTDNSGKATISVTYPDNVTGWQTYFVAMDKRRRIGLANVFTQAVKPIVAQLNLPTFLIEADTSIIIGKSLNHTADTYQSTGNFFINNVALPTIQNTLKSNDATINEQPITIYNTDTATIAFKLQTNSGFKDGEERKIPVFKIGTNETIGNFWVLQNDTTVQFKAIQGSKEIKLYAQDNTLDVLLLALEELKNYPFACMEQTASKLSGLENEKQIKAALKLPFYNQKIIDQLLLKLQKEQNFDGGWPWWENGKSNFYITNYIINILLVFRANPLVETNVRNGFIYLQNQLQSLPKNELVAALYTLSQGKHELDYAKWLMPIAFDSLPRHAQWQQVQILQNTHKKYTLQLDSLLTYKKQTILGGLYWGNDNYRWYSNANATTVLAYNVLKNDSAYKYLLPSIIQYFIETKKGNTWRNTVEVASIIQTILPQILAQQQNFNTPASLAITGDTSYTIKTFPYKAAIKNNNIKNIAIQNTGGGMVYFTANQQVFNSNPIPVNNNFVITTSFLKNKQPVTEIKAGQKITMKVNVQALKDAEFLMLEIPIPAGCIYANKSNNDYGIFKEFYKNKVLLFTEFLKTGNHIFEIELEPRYKGNYTLNPAKVELMYYPTFYGRNGVEKVKIID